MVNSPRMQATKATFLGLPTATNCSYCGVHHAAIVREELATRHLEKDEAARPWRYWVSSEDAETSF